MNPLNKTSLFYNYYFVKELFSAVIFLLIFSFIKNFKYLKYASLLMVIILLYFFRNNCKITEKKAPFISPSSSKVISIKEKGNMYEILTYLSPLDRHFMVAPVECKVINIERILLKGDAERTRVTFKDKRHNIFSLDQIVKKPMKGIGVFGGWVPKLFYKNRVITTCKKGDTLKQGERWGLIRFGSNMLYRFPKHFLANFKHFKTGKSYNVGDIIV